MFCLKQPLPLLSLLGTGCIGPRLIPSLLFSHSLSFLLFISSPFHSAADKRFHSRWVCSKQDIHFCYSAARSLSVPPPQLHFNDILCLLQFLTLSKVSFFFSPSFNLGRGALLSKNMLQSILMLLCFFLFFFQWCNSRPAVFEIDLPVVRYKLQILLTERKRLKESF